MRILAIDLGGTHVKVLTNGQREPRKAVSGPGMTPRQMVAAVKKLAADWSYDVLSLGYPGPVVHGRPVAEPKNLGPGWVGFDFRKAFRKPVRMLNDAGCRHSAATRGILDPATGGEIYDLFQEYEALQSVEAKVCEGPRQP